MLDRNFVNICGFDMEKAFCIIIIYWKPYMYQPRNQKVIHLMTSTCPPYKIRLLKNVTVKHKKVLGFVDLRYVEFWMQAQYDTIALYLLKYS